MDTFTVTVLPVMPSGSQVVVTLIELAGTPHTSGVTILVKVALVHGPKATAPCTIA